jgi:hypothetical protein
MMVDEACTVKDAINYISSKGFKVSLGRTFQLYGLKYIDDRAFTSKYKQEFNLSESKTLYDIQLKELRQYRDLLTGHKVKGF